MPARRLLIAVCALALTACTPLIDDPSSPSTAAPAASETSGNESTTADAQAPTFELGEFDPEGDFELFDPCTEIPAEVLTEAGFGSGYESLSAFQDAVRQVTGRSAARSRGRRPFRDHW